MSSPIARRGKAKSMCPHAHYACKSFIPDVSKLAIGAESVDTLLLLTLLFICAFIISEFYRNGQTIPVGEDKADLSLIGACFDLAPFRPSYYRLSFGVSISFYSTCSFTLLHVRSFSYASPSYEGNGKGKPAPTRLTKEQKAAILFPSEITRNNHGSYAQ
jgi:hypothetical protein